MDLFLTGSNNVVPIVMGAHPEDFKALAPFRSYLHVEDYDSPQELAVHMKFLMEHPLEYNKYFEWKGTGQFISSSFFCQICAMVHYADLVKPPTRETKLRYLKFLKFLNYLKEP